MASLAFFKMKQKHEDACKITGVDFFRYWLKPMYHTHVTGQQKF